MKMKSLLVCAISALLAAPFAYISPAYADETTDNQSMSTPAAPSDQNTDQSQSNSSENMPSQDTGSSNSNNNDQNATPDTATGGDDDY